MLLPAGARSPLILAITGRTPNAEVMQAMKQALKGAALSALVFPGLGQIVLGRGRRGAVLIVIVLAALAGIVVQATRIALGILDKVQAGGAVPDLDTITAATHEALQAGGAGPIQWLLVLIAACWLFAIVDAYRVGRALDAAASG
jgi:TM2 domain-containing membrane protein YozV